MGMIGIKLGNQSFNARIAKIMKKYTSESISDIKLKVINGEYIYTCDYTNPEGIKIIIAIQQEMKKNGINSEIYEHDEITTIEFLNNLLTAYKETEQQIEMELLNELRSEYWLSAHE